MLVGHVAARNESSLTYPTAEAAGVDPVDLTEVIKATLPGLINAEVAKCGPPSIVYQYNGTVIINQGVSDKGKPQAAAKKQRSSKPKKASDSLKENNRPKGEIVSKGGPPTKKEDGKSCGSLPRMAS